MKIPTILIAGATDNADTIAAALSMPIRYNNGELSILLLVLVYTIIFCIIRTIQFHMWNFIDHFY